MVCTEHLAHQINLAVAAHGMWKARLVTAIERGSSEFTVEGVARDDLCEFGKWLQGLEEGRQDPPPHLARVRALHAAFHQAAAEVLAMAHAGRRAEAERALQSEFQARSVDLVRALQQWKRG